MTLYGAIRLQEKIHPPIEPPQVKAHIEHRVILWMLLWQLNRHRALATCDEIVRTRPVPDRLLWSIYGLGWLRDAE